MSAVCSPNRGGNRRNSPGTLRGIPVTADAAPVNTESKEFSSNINQTAINELPINGRRWSNFAILTPGSVPDGSFGPTGTSRGCRRSCIR